MRQRFEFRFTILTGQQEQSQTIKVFDDSEESAARLASEILLRRIGPFELRRLEVRHATAGPRPGAARRRRGPLAAQRG